MPQPAINQSGDRPVSSVTIEQVLADPAGSTWLKIALRTALARDPVDSANDTEVLARLLDERCRKVLTEDPIQTK